MAKPLTSSTPSRWLISQIGSREHYACPVAFERQGALRLFYTDAWAGSFHKTFSRLPGPLAALSRRYHSELPPDKVVSFTLGGLRHERNIRAQKTSEARYQGYLDAGQWFAQKVANHMRKLTLDPTKDVHLAFSTGGVESMEYAKSRGVRCVLDQLDPAQVDEEMIREESARWPGWEALPGAIPPAYYARLAREWALADFIIVNSEFSKRAIHQQGVPLEKLVVVPLAYEAEGAPKSDAPCDPQRPIQVLWLGQVVLRKGIPYLFEAARLLEKKNIQFLVAGRIGISDTAVRSAPPNLKVLGQIPRDRALELYKSSDLFVLPTISDGFAITQIEAMSYGLPVITTPNCGDVVTPGVDGLIVPIRDPAALADAILTLSANETMLKQMSAAARVKSAQFTMSRYATTIEQALQQFAPPPSPQAAPTSAGGPQ